MKERFKMIFDRIDILVVCIVFWCSLTVAEAYMGFWKGFAQCFIMTFLITEVCYTLRCNEKLKKELIEANWRRNDTEKELDVANQRCAWRQKLIDLYSLLVKKRNAQFECEHAKLNYCKYKITSEELASVMNRTDKEISEISDKIVELDKELNEFYK
jgi:phosphoglycerate-specific signal transduction histidine kinase